MCSYSDEVTTDFKGQSRTPAQKYRAARQRKRSAGEFTSLICHVVYETATVKHTLITEHVHVTYTKN